MVQIDCSNNIYKHDMKDEIRIEIENMDDKEVCKLVFDILRDKYRDATRIIFEIKEQEYSYRFICTPEYQYDS